MPIRGMTDRASQFPEIGSIRKGAKKAGNAPGPDLKYFRVEIDESQAQTARDFRAAYGAAPTELNIFLPFDDVERNFDTWLEAYTAGALVYRSDGESVLYELDPQTGERKVVNGNPRTQHRENPIGYYANKQGRQEPINAKATGRLKVIIPELGRLAFLTVHTTSTHDVINLSRQLQALLDIHGKLAGVPLKLRRRPVKVSTPTPDGKRARREKWLLSVEADPEWVRAKLADMKRLALPESDGTLALPAPVVDNVPTHTPPAFTSAVDDDDDDEVTEGDIDSTEAEGEQPTTGAQSTQAETRPYSAARVKSRLIEKAKSHAGKTANQSQIGLAAGMLTQCFAGDADAEKKRHTVTRYLTGHESLSDVEHPHVLAILDWLKPARDSGGHYEPDAMAAREAAAIVHQALIDAGQLDLFEQQQATVAEPDPF